MMNKFIGKGYKNLINFKQLFEKTGKVCYNKEKLR